MQNPPSKTGGSCHIVDGLLQVQAQMPGHAVVEQGIVYLVTSAIALGFAHAICADVWRGLKLVAKQVADTVITVASAVWNRVVSHRG